MRRQLSRLGRGAGVAAVAAVALVVAFVVLTVAGVGGDDDPPRRTTGPPAAPRPSTKTALQKYSEESGRRESGVPAEAGGPSLAQEPPTPPQSFRRPIASYRRYAVRQSRLLAGDIRRLDAAVGSGNRSQARAAWTVAFTRYLRLGAVYGLFGELDQDIDGLPGGLPRGTHDPDFRGLHRLELGLWTHEPVRSLAPVVRGLARDVARLPATIAKAEIAPLDYSLRAHEILEGAQRDFLTGIAVPWSGEGVRATDSGLVATQVVMDTLRPILLDGDVALRTRAELAKMRRTLDAIAAAHHGRLPTLAGLRHDERARLAAGLGALLERLQYIPEALATVDAPAIPRLDP